MSKKYTISLKDQLNSNLKDILDNINDYDTIDQFYNMFDSIRVTKEIIEVNDFENNDIVFDFEHLKEVSDSPLIYLQALYYIYITDPKLISADNLLKSIKYLNEANNLYQYYSLDLFHEVEGVTFFSSKNRELIEQHLFFLKNIAGSIELKDSKRDEILDGLEMLLHKFIKQVITTDTLFKEERFEYSASLYSLVETYFDLDITEDIINLCSVEDALNIFSNSRRSILNDKRYTFITIQESDIDSKKDKNLLTLQFISDNIDNKDINFNINSALAMEITDSKPFYDSKVNKYISGNNLAPLKLKLLYIQTYLLSLVEIRDGLSIPPLNNLNISDLLFEYLKLNNDTLFTDANFYLLDAIILENRDIFNIDYKLDNNFLKEVQSLKKDIDPKTEFKLLSNLKSGSNLQKAIFDNYSTGDMHQIIEILNYYRYKAIESTIIKEYNRSDIVNSGVENER
jgi:hypothetical protein